MISYLIIFLLFILQFIYFPIGVSFFESPKVYLAQIFIFILLAVSIFKSDDFTIKKYKSSFLAGIIAILILSLIHLVIFPIQNTFFGNIFRMQGVFTLWMLILFIFLSSGVNILSKINSRFIFVIMLVQLLAVFFVDSGEAGRAIGTLGEPNALAATAVFIWPFLWFEQKRTNTILKIAALVMTFLIIILSGSRSGIVAFMIQLVFIFLISRFKFSLKKSVIICLILLGISLALPFIEQNGIYEKRNEIWQTSIIAGIEKPILGHGFGNIESAISDSSSKLDNNLRGSYVDSSHNIFLDWFISGGIVGLGAFLFLIFNTLSLFIKGKKTLSIVLLLGIIAALSFNPASIVSLVALWWLIGQGSFYNQSKV